MKYLLGLLSFCLVMSSTQLFAEVTGARLELKESEYDFGTVAQGTKVTHDFSLRNGGTADIVIQKVIPSCGCTATSVSTNTIIPGAEGTIKFEFDTTGFSGRKLKSVQLLTNDPNSPVTMLTLTGSIQEDIVVDPDRVFFGDVVKGEAATQEVTVKVRDGANAKISGVKSYSDSLRIVTISSSPTAQKFSVSLNSDVPVGELRTRIVIGVVDRSTRAVNIPVFASVKGTVEFKPSALSLGVLQPQQPAQGVVRFLNHDSHPLKITGIKSDNDAVHAEYKQIQAGMIYVINVKVDPSKVQRDLRATVTVTTNNPETPEYVLNVYGVKPPTLN